MSDYMSAAVQAHDWLRQRGHDQLCSRPTWACDCLVGGSAMQRDVPAHLWWGMRILIRHGEAVAVGDTIRLRLYGTPWRRDTQARQGEEAP